MQRHYALVEYAPGSITPWIVAFLGVDFFYYWWHRLSHRVNFMWSIHVVHHQSEDYNLAVALRQAWFSSVTLWFFYLPMAFLGIPPLVFLAMSSFSTLYQFWIHTRTVGKLGPLEWLLNTPSLHRVHHGRNPKYLDKNYGATLITWDRLFGTCQEEEEEPLYGTVKPYASWNSIWANFYYWVEMAKEAWHAPHWIDKIKVWFMYPGWHPRGIEKPAAPSQAGPERPIRFHTKIPKGLNWYIAVQFVPVTVAATALLFMRKTTTFSQQAGLAGIILLTALIWGGLFEKKSWALPLELGRLILLGAATTAYLWESKTAWPAAAAAVAVLLMLALWILRYRHLFMSAQPSISGGQFFIKRET
jgi:hypothetical protein